MANTVSVLEKPVTDELRWNLLQKKAQQLRAVRAFELFRQSGIEPILIKGLAAGRFYPDDQVRISIDLDLAVSARNYDAALSIAGSKAANGLAIDLHRDLRHFDTVPWADLFENSILLDFDGGTVRVLCPEDHLRVLCLHWLTNGGSDKDRLWDIYYSIENRPHSFDWELFLDVVSPRRRRWLTTAVGLAQKYLGLDLTDTPLHAEAKDIPPWVVKTVEREWAAKNKAMPLETTIYDPKKLAIQIIKRFRPNPIWATIQMEGSFDAKTRVFYQIANAISRIVPSYRRVSQTIKHHSK